MDWDHLRFFVELARRGSLSETSRHLNADHSTVGRRIAALESALGLKLFDRMPRGYVLTEQGTLLAERAAQVEEAVFAVERLAAGAVETVAGEVRISAPPVLASQWLVPLLAPLRRQHPALVLDVIGAIDAANLVQREADMALRLSRPIGDSLVARKLGMLRYGLYGSRAYIDTAPEAAWEFLGYDEYLADVPQQRWIENFAGGRRFALRSNDLASLISAARAGIGLTVVPHVLASDSADLVCLAEAPEAARELWLAFHPDLRRSARIRVLLDRFDEIAERLPR
jgi:DNA-binding transcriptional LysR family regulator